MPSSYSHIHTCNPHDSCTIFKISHILALFKKLHFVLIILTSLFVFFSIEKINQSNESLIYKYFHFLHVLYKN